MPGFNGLGKDDRKTRRETFKFLGFGVAHIRCFTVYLPIYPWLLLFALFMNKNKLYHSLDGYQYTALFLTLMVDGADDNY